VAAKRETVLRKGLRKRITVKITRYLLARPAPRWRSCAQIDLKVPPLLVLERCYGTVSWRTAIVGRAFVE